MGLEDRVWTRQRARDEGVPRGRLTGGLEFVRVAPGCYVEACWAEDLLTRAAGVLQAAPGALLSHWTALAAHGLPVPSSVTGTVHVTVPPHGTRPRWAGVEGHRSSTLTAYVVDGLRVTGAVRSWCDAAALVSEGGGPGGDLDLGRGRTGAAAGRVRLAGRVDLADRVDLARATGRADLADLVAAGDALLARRPGTVVDVRNQLSLRPAGRGTAVAERAVRLLDGRAESPQESRLRVLLAGSDLPAPVVQHEVRDRSGSFVARVDLAYPAARLAVEYDGDHHRGRAQWRHDLARRERLELLGWRVVVVVAADLLGDPGSVMDRVRRALASRAA